MNKQPKNTSSVPCRFMIFSSLAVLASFGGCNGWQRHTTATTDPEPHSSKRQQRIEETLPVPPVDLLRVPTYSQKFRLGQGYSSLDGAEKGFSVVSSQATASPNDVGAHITFNLQSASSLYELADKLSVSVSGSFNGVGGGASASYAYAKSVFSRKESEYVIVMVDVRNAAQGLNDYKLEQPALAAAKTLSEAEFYKRYGDHFISADISGGSYRAVTEILNDDLAEKEDTKASLEGHMGSFSTAAEMTHELSVVTQNKQTKISVLKNGGTRTINISDLVKEATDFPTTVAPDKDPVALEYELKPYTVTDWPYKRTAPNVDAAYATLKYLREQKLKMADLIELLEFAYERPDLFERYDPKQLEKMIKQTDATITQIDARAAQTLQNPTSRSVQIVNYLDSYQPLPVFKNPETLPVRLTVSPQDQISPTIKDDGSMVGAGGKWIQSLGIGFADKTYGLSVLYDTSFLRVYNYTQKEAPTFSGSNGGAVGKINGGDFYALHSISLKLKGPRARYYDIIYRGKMADGTTVEKRNGEFLLAPGAEYYDRPAKLLGPFNIQTAQSFPTAYIEQISVQVKKKSGM
jgi:hypothetical protein